MAMKRLAAATAIIFFLFTEIHAQENTAEPEQAQEKETSYSAEYWLFGSVSAVLLGWGVGSWGWGSAKFRFENDGWGIEQDSYTGGADKWSHAWGIYLCSRIGSYTFENSGDSREKSAVKGFFFGQFVGLAMEVGDGFGQTYGFAWGDMVWNFSGGVVALLFDLYPPLDNLLCFQMEYWPSEDYLSQKPEKKIEITSDVTGQKFLLGLRMSGIPFVKDTFLRYFQIDCGFYTRGYWYHPSSYTYKTRHAYIGFAFNLTTVSESLLPAGSWRNAVSRFFKYYHPPIAYNPDVLDHTFAGRTPSDP